MSENKRHVCPQCGYEYEPWVEICPDCGVLVIDVEDVQTGRKAATLGKDEDPHWTFVTNVPNAIIGSLLKSQLEDAGIPVLMRRSASADIAQFSGNDFVPHDLLVPANKETEARELLDSSSDISTGPPYWAGGYHESGDAYEDEPELDSRDRAIEQLRRLWDADPTPDSTSDRKLPDGWTMLPTERDVRARAHHQRTHGEEGWNWQEADQEMAERERADAESALDDVYPPDPSQWQSKMGYEYGQPSVPRLQRIETQDYDSSNWDTGGSSRWIRILYGILLTVMSLPFLFQLIREITGIFK